MLCGVVMDDLFKSFRIQRLLQSIQMSRQGPGGQDNQQAFSALKNLAQSTSHHFSIDSHDDVDSGRAKVTVGELLLDAAGRRWSAINDGELLCVLHRERTLLGMSISFLVATKSVLDKNKIDALGHTAPTTKAGCFLVFKINFTSSDGKHVRRIFIQSRGVCPALRQHKVMKRVSLGILNHVRPYLTEGSVISNASVHPATWLFMAVNEAEYQRIKQSIAILQKRSEGSSFQQRSEKKALAVMDYQAERLRQADNQKVPSQLFAQPRARDSLARDASVSAVCRCVVM